VGKQEGGRPPKVEPFGLGGNRETVVEGWGDLCSGKGSGETDGQQRVLEEKIRCSSQDLFQAGQRPGRNEGNASRASIRPDAVGVEKKGVKRGGLKHMIHKEKGQQASEARHLK